MIMTNKLINVTDKYITSFAYTAEINIESHKSVAVTLFLNENNLARHFTLEQEKLVKILLHQNNTTVEQYFCHIVAITLN